MSFLIAVVVFAAVILVFMLIERIYLSPSKPKWLDNESVVMPICVAFTGVFASSAGAVVATSLALPLGLWGDVVASVVAIVALIVGVRALFRMLTRSGRVATG